MEYEYDDSEYNSYEDDFETPDSSEKKSSTKGTQENQAKTSLNREFKDLSYKRNSRSYENSKSPRRPISNTKPVKKSFQDLLNENNELRLKFNKINEELNHLLSTFPKKRPAKRPTYFPNSSNTKLQVYINEYESLKIKVDKIMSPEYLISLRTEIKEKKQKISDIEKEIKKLKKDQKTRDKNLEEFWVEDFTPNELTTFGHMNDQLFKYREQIEKIENQYSKDKETYEILKGKEEELDEKLEKLETLWKIYNSDSDLNEKNKLNKDRFDILVKQFELAKTIGANKVVKLQTKEKASAFEIENMKKEKKALEIQLEIREKEAIQHNKELQDVAINISQHDMGHLLNLIKLNRPENLSSEVVTIKSPPPEEKKRKKFDELFLTEKKERLSEKIESKPEVTVPIIREKTPIKKTMTGNGPKYLKKSEEVIEEYLPEEEESFQPQLKRPSILKDLEQDKKEIPQFIKPIEKSSLLKDLESAENNSKSFLEELEKPFKNTIFNKPIFGEDPLKKPISSNFTESETKTTEKLSPEKSSFFSELEQAAPKFEPFKNPAEKKSIFEELDGKNSDLFKNPFDHKSIINDFDSQGKADSFFKPTERSLFGQKEPIKDEPKSKVINNEESAFLAETDPKPNVFAKPRGRDRSHLFNKKENNIFQRDNQIKFSSLSPERNANDSSDLLSRKEEKNSQGYLAGGILDKMKVMAERAEKMDFFGDFYEKNNEIKLTSKLLPTKLENPQSVNLSSFNTQDESKLFKPKSNPFTLDDEDISL